MKEAKYYEEKSLLATPSLDTIKESPSTTSVAGLLYGGFSSASINTVLQASTSCTSVKKELEEYANSPAMKGKFDHKQNNEQNQDASDIPIKRLEEDHVVCIIEDGEKGSIEIAGKTVDDNSMHSENVLGFTIDQPPLSSTDIQKDTFNDDTEVEPFEIVDPNELNQKDIAVQSDQTINVHKLSESVKIEGDLQIQDSHDDVQTGEKTVKKKKIAQRSHSKQLFHELDAENKEHPVIETTTVSKKVDTFSITPGYVQRDEGQESQASEKALTKMQKEAMEKAAKAKQKKSIQADIKDLQDTITNIEDSPSKEICMTSDVVDRESKSELQQREEKNQKSAKNIDSMKSVQLGKHQNMSKNYDLKVDDQDKDKSEKENKLHVLKGECSDDQRQTDEIGKIDNSLLKQETKQIDHWEREKVFSNACKESSETDESTKFTLQENKNLKDNIENKPLSCKEDFKELENLDEKAVVDKKLQLKEFKCKESIQDDTLVADDEAITGTKIVEKSCFDTQVSEHGNHTKQDESQSEEFKNSHLMQADQMDQKDELEKQKRDALLEGQAEISLAVSKNNEEKKCIEKEDMKAKGEEEMKKEKRLLLGQEKEGQEREEGKKKCLEEQVPRQVGEDQNGMKNSKHMVNADKEKKRKANGEEIMKEETEKQVQESKKSTKEEEVSNNEQINIVEINSDKNKE